MSKMRNTVGSLLAAFLSAGSAQAAIVIAGPVENLANGHRYYLLSMDTWDASQEAAVKLGGSLVTIDDDAEQVWVFDTFSRHGGVGRNLWIGLNDVAQEGVYVWADGSKSQYRNWAVFEPNNVGSIEHYVHMIYPENDRAGKWNDVAPFYTTIDEHPVCGVVEVSPPQITIKRAVAIEWQATAGKRYQVQWAGDLTGHQWVDFGSVVTGDGTMKTSFDVASSSARYYRVKEL